MTNKQPQQPNSGELHAGPCVPVPKEYFLCKDCEYKNLCVNDPQKPDYCPRNKRGEIWVAPPPVSEQPIEPQEQGEIVSSSPFTYDYAFQAGVQAERERVLAILKDHGWTGVVYDKIAALKGDK